MPNFRPRARTHQSQVEFAEAFLRARDVVYRKPSPHHLQIGQEVNYWPTTGGIHIKGEACTRSETGLAALEAVLREFDYLPGAGPTISAPTSNASTPPVPDERRGIAPEADDVPF